jgi:hypothetical protein
MENQADPPTLSETSELSGRVGRSNQGQDGRFLTLNRFPFICPTGPPPQTVCPMMALSAELDGVMPGRGPPIFVDQPLPLQPFQGIRQIHFEAPDEPHR